MCWQCLGLYLSCGIEKMGCLKLTYQENEDANFFQGLWKKSDGSEKSYKYYPFGLQTANSWSREEVMPNAFLYNGGSELNSVTNNYEMFFREYDPTLGRMNAIDPMASKYASLSPYNYAFNDPVYFNDPSGADPYGDDDNWWNGPRSGWGKWSYGGPGAFANEQRLNAMASSNVSMYGGGFSSRNGAFGMYGQGTWSGPTYQEILDHRKLVAENSLVTIYENGSFVNGGEGFFYTVNTPYAVHLGYNFDEVVAGSAQRLSTSLEPVERQTQTGSGDKSDQGGAMAGAVTLALTLSAADGPLPVGEIIGLGIIAGVYIHANSKNSPKPNIVYEIYSYNSVTGYQTMKYGISSQADFVRWWGNPRPEYQVAALNLAEPMTSNTLYWYNILDRTPDRASALELEAQYVRAYQASHGGLRPPLQIRP